MKFVLFFKYKKVSKKGTDTAKVYADADSLRQCIQDGDRLLKKDYCCDFKNQSDACFLKAKLFDHWGKLLKACCCL